MTKTTRFSPPTAIGGAIPFDGLEQYNPDEATDEELIAALKNDRSPAWYKDAIKQELKQREEEDGVSYG